MDEPGAKTRVRVADRILDLTGAFVANGQMMVQRIDNGFLIHVTTVVTPHPGAMFGTQRVLFCSTVQDVLTTLSDLLQLPGRPDAAGNPIMPMGMGPS